MPQLTWPSLRSATRLKYYPLGVVREQWNDFGARDGAFQGLAELRCGAERRKSKRLHHLIDVFTSNVSVLPFDEACGARFGKLASELVTRGTPIGDFDTLIAAHAMELHLTLITNHRTHFNRVAGLNVENWV